MKKLLMFVFAVCMGCALLSTSVPTDARHMGPGPHDGRQDKHGQRCECHKLAKNGCHKCPNCRWHQERHKRGHDISKCVPK